MERIHFYSEGQRIVGDLFEVQGADKGPAVVLCHGFTGVKEMIMPTVGERFAAAGITALSFDYRHFGESEGEPRSLLNPMAQVRDIRASAAAPPSTRLASTTGSAASSP
jgi:hypothetical protein